MGLQNRLDNQEFSKLTINDLHEYIYGLYGILFSDNPPKKDNCDHRILLKTLLRNAHTETKKLFDGRKITHRNEIALFFNPCSFTRSPHIEMALNLHYLAQSINIPTVIYISNIPSLGNIKNFQANFTKEAWNIDKLNSNLTSLITDLIKDSLIAPKIINLHKQSDKSTKLVDIVHESVGNLFIGDSFPFHSVAFSGGGSDFLGGWGLEWLDTISLYSQHRSLALMGWNDIPLYNDFYKRYIGPENHPLKNYNFSKNKIKNFLIVRKQVHFQKHITQDENEKKLRFTIENKALNNPLLIFASNDLHKRANINDIISLIRYKFLIPNLKIITIGRQSEIFKNILLGINVNKFDNNCFRFKSNLPKHGDFEFTIEFGPNTTIDSTLYNSESVFSFNSFKISRFAYQ